MVAENGHLTPEEITSYLGRSVTRAESATIERHLVMCETCRRDLQEAWELGHGRRRVRWRVVGVAAAAAAVALLLVPATRFGSGERSSPVFRGGQAEGTPTFEALAPTDRATVDPDTVVFRWRSGGVQVHYHLTLTDANGDVVWEATTSDTAVSLPPTVRLSRGQRYFWYVDALLEGARSSTTGVREFMIEP